MREFLCDTPCPQPRPQRHLPKHSHHCFRLALAAVGISMGVAGSDTAIEASSIAILDDRLETIPFLVRLGRATIATIKLNTSLAVVTKVKFVPLALSGWSNLALAIFADVGVTIVVILNSLRLLRFDSSEP